MIEALRELGLYSLQEKGSNLNNELDIIVQNPHSRTKENKVIVINFIGNNSAYEYINTTIEDFDKDNPIKYLYKRKGSKGADFTPTSRLSADQNAKNFDIKKT